MAVKFFFSIAREKDTMDWSDARTFADLVVLNVRFLRGKLKETPYHGAPVDEETVPLLPKLIRINQLGFVSTQGHPADRESGRYKQSNPFFKKGMREYYIYEQKSFIEGILLKSRAASFVNFMRARKDVYTFVKDPLTGKTLLNNFPTSDYHVGRSKVFASPSGHTKMPWQLGISTRSDDSLDLAEEFHRYPEIQAMIVDKCVEVTMAGKKWSSGLVEDALLSYLDPPYSRAPGAEEKIRNPRTGRWVKRYGKIGRRLLR
jgi:hypothetical protein